jgi:myo-inositol-1(or 4)-monophosphatase
VSARPEDLRHIAAALDEVAVLFEYFLSREVTVEHNAPGDPVTEADYAVDRALRKLLPRPGEGWLSEETEDDPARLDRESVWIIDPIDGTREFVAGIPEWGVSIGLVVDGVAVAGGFLNPASGLRVIGGVGLGCETNGKATRVSDGPSLADTKVLASRSEYGRGEWTRYERRGFTVQPTGSVAHKLALLAAGQGDATWSLIPKHEWDVAGGVALVEAAGGVCVLPDGSPPRFNQPDPLIDGLISAGPERMVAIRALIGDDWSPRSER